MALRMATQHSTSRFHKLLEPYLDVWYLYEFVVVFSNNLK